MNKFLCYEANLFRENRGYTRVYWEGILSDGPASDLFMAVLAFVNAGSVLPGDNVYNAAPLPDSLFFDCKFTKYDFCFSKVMVWYHWLYHELWYGSNMKRRKFEGKKYYG